MNTVTVEALRAWSCDGLKWLSKRPGQVISAVAVAVLVTARIRLASVRRERRKRWAKIGKDIVVLHGFPRGRYTPNASPFVMKLETYLRLAKITYVFDDTEPIGPKGQGPWITLNGEEIADSQLIIEALGRKFDKNFTSRLPKEQQAIALAMNLMMTEHITWGLRIWRYVIDKGEQLRKCSRYDLVSELAVYLWFPRIAKKRAWAQGIGRHSEKEVEEMMRQDFAALSDYLGDKPFLMGDNPCEVDCTLFGYISQVLWNYNGSPYGKMVKEDYPNLEAHHSRMKTLLYPDWDALSSLAVKE
ncbi:failed axon connections-like [Palaemon carinicauda]|uniref:failed axon connections-like n=1 Tax=Palaemon carinicauda TaxID=392227 RepID=UPI0035B5996B